MYVLGELTQAGVSNQHVAGEEWTMGANQGCASGFAEQQLANGNWTCIPMADFNKVASGDYTPLSTLPVTSNYQQPGTLYLPSGESVATKPAAPPPPAPPAPPPPPPPPQVNTAGAPAPSGPAAAANYPIMLPPSAAPSDLAASVPINPPAGLTGLSTAAKVGLGAVGLGALYLAFRRHPRGKRA